MLKITLLLVPDLHCIPSHLKQFPRSLQSDATRQFAIHYETSRAPLPPFAPYAVGRINSIDSLESFTVTANRMLEATLLISPNMFFVSKDYVDNNLLLILLYICNISS
jgi:hypothetical protein